MILVVVYVGAVAVLFMFVVMMLDIGVAELRRLFYSICHWAALSASFCFLNWVLSLQGLSYRRRFPNVFSAPAPADIPNTEAIGQLLYTKYVYFFQAAGMILLVAMIGAIVLTHRSREGVKKQRIGQQVDRRPEETLEIKKVQTGERDLMLEIGLAHYLTLAAILFTLGVFGIFLNRKNVIIILMSIELILLAININLVSFSSHLGDLVGQVFALLVLTVAAGEAAIGLAILVVYFRNRGSIAVEDIRMMKG